MKILKMSLVFIGSLRGARAWSSSAPRLAFRRRPTYLPSTPGVEGAGSNVVRGAVEKIVFRSDNGYTVAKLRLAEEADEQVCYLR